jgi:hypothetical protein
MSSARVPVSRIQTGTGMGGAEKRARVHESLLPFSVEHQGSAGQAIPHFDERSSSDNETADDME